MFAHIDADAFFASVLQRKYPQYANKPLIALGMGGSSVISASYECKAKKVRTGMRLYEAKKLCPEAIAIPSDFTETALASKQIQGILEQISPIIEQASIDEWYVDLRACPGGVPTNIEQWAKQQQGLVTRSTAIPVSIGIAPTKLLAKMASDFNKPKGICVVQNASSVDKKQSYTITITDFLQALPAAAIPGIGQRRQVHAEAMQWRTAYNIAKADAASIQRILGKSGLEMQRELCGEVVQSITMEYIPPKSISRCRSFTKTNNQELIFAYLCHHLSYTIIKLRRKQLMCKWIAVSIRTSEYKSFGKDYKLPMPVDTEEQLLPYIQQLFKKLHTPGAYYTQISLTIGMFSSKAAKQFNLFEDPTTIIKGDTIQQTLDTLHKTLGRDSIMRGSALLIKSGVRRGVPFVE
jgi:DNA polymerase IV